MSTGVFDCRVNSPDLFQGTVRCGRFGEGDHLSVVHGPEESADWILRQAPGEEQPIDRAIHSKFRRSTTKDEEERIRLAPNLPGYGVLDRTVWHEEEISRAPNAGCRRPAA
jgi:hypothetical protein